jgi:hypothetical protein
LVIAPSSASPLAVTVAGASNTTTALAPASANVPADNKIDAADAVALVATAETGTTVSFTTTGGVRLVLALDSSPVSPVLASAGTTTYSVKSQGVSITVYAFTTSTATGAVTITNGAYSTIVYVKGNVGPAYNVGVLVPATSAVGTIPLLTVNVTDVFGNPVGGETVSTTLIGSTWDDGSISKSIVTSTSVDVSRDVKLSLGSKTEKLAVATAGTVTVAATGATAATAVVGLAAPVKAVVASFTVTDLNGTIAALNAQIASLNAILNSQGASLNAQIAAANVALIAEKSARAADKAAADKALADAKAASESATVTAKAAADKALADAKAAADKALADAKAVSESATVTAKAAADKALADAKAAAESAAVTAKAASDLELAKAAAAYKAQYNALAKKWNAKNPKAKVALKK